MFRSRSSRHTLSEQRAGGSGTLEADSSVTNLAAEIPDQAVSEQITPVVPAQLPERFSPKLLFWGCLGLGVLAFIVVLLPNIEAKLPASFAGQYFGLAWRNFLPVLGGSLLSSAGMVKLAESKARIRLRLADAHAQISQTRSALSDVSPPKALQPAWLHKFSRFAGPMLLVNHMIVLVNAGLFITDSEHYRVIPHVMLWFETSFFLGTLYLYHRHRAMEEGLVTQQLTRLANEQTRLRNQQAAQAQKRHKFSHLVGTAVNIITLGHEAQSDTLAELMQQIATPRQNQLFKEMKARYADLLEANYILEAVCRAHFSGNDSQRPSAIFRSTEFILADLIQATLSDMQHRADNKGVKLIQPLPNQDDLLDHKNRFLGSESILKRIIWSLLSMLIEYAQIGDKVMLTHTCWPEHVGPCALTARYVLSTKSAAVIQAWQALQGNQMQDSAVLLKLEFLDRLVKSANGRLEYKVNALNEVTIKLSLPLERRPRVLQWDGIIQTPLVKRMHCSLVQSPNMKRIMLVDDDPVIRKLFVKIVTGISLSATQINQRSCMIEGRGVQCTTTADGSEAVKLIQAKPRHYKLVLMDLNMPILNGVEATQQIRSLEAENSHVYHHTIFLVSASGYDPVAYRQSHPEFDAIYQKPYSRDKIQRWIRVAYASSVAEDDRKTQMSPFSLQPQNEVV